MGCFFTKNSVLDDEDSESADNVFDVINLDQDGNENLEGKIEITDEYLLLHQNRSLTTCWPIRALRRYGSEDNIFSFEAGRRCPTGPGIYVFKCDKANQLFAMLQANIQRTCAIRNCETGNHYLEPRVVNVRQFRLESVGSTGSCPVTPVSPMAPSTASSTMAFKFDNSETINATSSDTILDPIPLISPPLTNNKLNQPLYMNIGIDFIAEDDEESGNHCYINIGKQMKRNINLSPISLPPMFEDAEFSFDEDKIIPRNVQYAVLEVQNDVSPIVKSAPIRYASIDFKRTLGLTKSKRPNIENDIGCKRRTRHNSNVI